MRLTDEEKAAQAQPERGEIAVQRVDRLAEWLEVTLGPRLAAFAAGLSTRELCLIAHGDTEPADDAERRLRNVFAVASLIANRDGAGTAYAWLTEPNADLDGRSPASLLHDGRTPESVWFAAAPTF